MPRIGRARVIGSAAGAPAAGWFGDGSDGDLTVAAGQTLALDVTADEGQIVKQYKNVTIESNALLKPAHRCRGMILLISGDLTLNGTISVDKCAPLLGDRETEMANEEHIKLCGALTGGNGGDGGTNTNSQAAQSGKGGIGFVFGGGFGAGSGGCSYGNHDKGGDGDPRPPVGSAIPYPSVRNAVVYGCGGSAQYGYSSSPPSVAGGGGPGGSGGAIQYNSPNYVYAPGANGDAIGGGAIWIFVKGKINISSTGKITANGGNGANGVQTSANAATAGGGAAGGGIVAVVYAGSLTNLGSVVADGGVGGAKSASSTSAGSNGTVGSVLITKLSDLLAA